MKYQIILNEFTKQFYLIFINYIYISIKIIAIIFKKIKFNPKK